MQSYQRTFIELALAHQALRFGEFTLKSGRLSPYFFNVGQLNSGLALKVLGECYASAIQAENLTADILFGPAYKGIPLVCSTAIALGGQQFPISYCFDRKEIKDHGEGGYLIGANVTEKTVLIIDDVITAGTAMREAMTRLQAAKARISGVIVALDRQEKGLTHHSALQEIQHHYQIPVKAIITLAHIMEYIAQQNDFSRYRQPMESYLKQYGVAADIK